MYSPHFLAGNPHATGVQPSWRIFSLLLIYSRVPDFSMHGREMYQRRTGLSGVTRSSNRNADYGSSSRNQATTEGDGGQIDPVILNVFPHKGQPFQ
jgi:hypothetical protein